MLANSSIRIDEQDNRMTLNFNVFMHRILNCKPQTHHTQMVDLANFSPQCDLAKFSTRIHLKACIIWPNRIDLAIFKAVKFSQDKRIQLKACKIWPIRIDLAKFKAVQLSKDKMSLRLPTWQIASTLFHDKIDRLVKLACPNRLGQITAQISHSQ